MTKAKNVLHNNGHTFFFITLTGFFQEFFTEQRQEFLQNKDRNFLHARTRILSEQKTMKLNKLTLYDQEAIFLQVWDTWGGGGGRGAGTRGGGAHD